MQHIAFDSHKRYTVALVQSADGRVLAEARIPHDRGMLSSFLSRFEPGSHVAVETIGNWYWIVDEIEAAGMKPQLVHARKAKLMMGMINKTDKLDVRGLNRLQMNKTLPVVWIPPGDLRDARELPRSRMALIGQRTQLKNRIHATLSKYAIHIDGVSDIFGARGRALMRERCAELPDQTRFVTEQLLHQLDEVQDSIATIERRMKEVFKPSPELQLLLSIPGIGFILAAVILNEIGDVSRFPDAAHLASYAGTTPRVHSSGGKTRFGMLRPDVNRYLKWAFIEAANCIVSHRDLYEGSHVLRLYARIRAKKDHPKAAGAVAHHLAESAYHILRKQELYREPNAVSSTEA